MSELEHATHGNQKIVDAFVGAVQTCDKLLEVTVHGFRSSRFGVREGQRKKGSPEPVTTYSIRNEVPLWGRAGLRAVQDSSQKISPLPPKRRVREECLKVS